MIRKAAIIYGQFLNRDGDDRAIGGVETYLLYLSKLLTTLHFEVRLFQSSNVEFIKKIDFMTVQGVKQKKFDKKQLYHSALSFVKNSDGILIFGADQASVYTDYKRSINIMHGVAWDLPSSHIIDMGGRFALLGKIPLVGKHLAKFFFGFSRLQDIKNTKYSVLVDYNSINWYKTQIADGFKGDYRVILNFVDIPVNFKPNLERHNDTIVKILFARRFQEYRGTSLMISASRKLLKKFSNIEITFAGDGPERAKIEKEFKNDVRVNIKKYLPEDSLIFHNEYHIAVVPSIASEGSSFSLAEAMGASCAVVATDVGGMTNMVIDMFNGLLIRPDDFELYSAISLLIEDKALRANLAHNAYNTAISAFSLSLWESKWKKLIEQVMH